MVKLFTIVKSILLLTEKNYFYLLLFYFIKPLRIVVVTTDLIICIHNLLCKENVYFTSTVKL